MIAQGQRRDNWDSLSPVSFLRSAGPPAMILYVIFRTRFAGERNSLSRHLAVGSTADSQMVVINALPRLLQVTMLALAGHAASHRARFRDLLLKRDWPENAPRCR